MFTTSHYRTGSLSAGQYGFNVLAVYFLYGLVIVPYLGWAIGFLCAFLFYRLTANRLSTLGRRRVWAWVPSVTFVLFHLQFATMRHVGPPLPYEAGGKWLIMLSMGCFAVSAFFVLALCQAKPPADGKMERE